MEIRIKIAQVQDFEDNKFKGNKQKVDLNIYNHYDLFQHAKGV